MNEEYMSDIGSAHRLFPDDTLKKDMHEHEPKQHHAMSSYSLTSLYHFPLNRMHHARLPESWLPLFPLALYLYL